MDMIGKVRRMKLRDQLSLSEIAKRTGLSRNTVKKWLKAPGDAVPKYERTVVPGKLTPFEPVLHQALATDSHRPKQGRRSGRALFAQIQAQGYPSQGHEMLFDAHTRSFQALGGITRRGIYDNMRTAVDKVQRGKQRIVNARFSAMCSHYLFDPDFCNIWGFGGYGLLAPACRLVSTSCSSGQRFAIRRPSDSQPPANPLPSAISSLCRASTGLSPPSGCAASCRDSQARPLKHDELARSAIEGDACCRQRLPEINTHSTVTLFARLRGLSTSVPRAHAVWYASSCSGTTCSNGLKGP